MVFKESKSILNDSEAPYMSEISKKYGLVLIYWGKLKYDTSSKVYFGFKL